MITLFNQIFGKSFVYESWIGIVTSLFTILTLFGSMTYLIRQLGLETDFHLGSFVAHMYCSQLCIGSPKEPRITSLRLVFFTISLAGYFIFSLYTGYIGAFLAIQIVRSPVNNLQDVLESPYDLAVAKGSSVEKYFTEALNDTIHFKLLSKGKITSKGRDPEALKLMLEGIRNSKYYLILKKICYHSIFILDTSSNHFVFGVYQPLKLLDVYPCQVSSVPVDYRKTGNGLVFQKNWPYTDLINNHLAKVGFLE